MKIIPWQSSYNPIFYGDYINRGIINVEQNRYMEALADYDRAVQLSPGNLSAYLNRAILRSNLGDNNNALDDFKIVLDMDSTIMEARYSKALLEMKLNNYQEAIADYQIIIDKHPYFLPAYWGIAGSIRSIEQYAGSPSIQTKSPRFRN